MDINTGIIERTEDGGTILRQRGNKAYLLEVRGVFCENPDADPQDRIYAKKFPASKKIYFPDEYERARAEVLGVGSTKNLFVLGGNGYSDLGAERRQAWGVEEGAYEAACEGLFRWIIQNLNTDFAGIRIGVSHGASGVGIDAVLIKVAKDFDLPQLGHTCPGYLFYVDADDKVPVVCLETKEEYAAAFVQSLDLLIGCNGGEQAFMQDLASVFRYKKHYLPVDVLGAISRGGSLQGVSGGKVFDAVNALSNYVHLIDMVPATPAADSYLHTLQQASEIVRAVARRSGNLSPQVAFVSLAQQLRQR